MDIQPQAQQPISDDQELAKVLAGITAGADTTAASDDLADGLEQEAATTPAGKKPAATADNEEDTTEAADVPPVPPVPPVPVAPAPVFDQTMSAGGELETVKRDAISELRPLVDKLNVSPEEKFDTYLLLIRSTDDSSLIAPAHDSAKAITDEARRAQALLDIIKEIDYLSNPQKSVA